MLKMLRSTKAWVAVPAVALIGRYPVKACVNSLRPRPNRRHFADDIFKCIFLNENIWIPIEISLKFVPKGPINNIPALVQIMAWRRSGDKPLSEPMMVSLLTHICVTRPQWVKEVYTNAGNAGSTCANLAGATVPLLSYNPAYRLHSGSVCRNYVVLFTPPVAPPRGSPT